MSSPSCFILAPTGAEIGHLVALVQGAGWAVLNSENAGPGADGYFDSSEELLRRSQAVLVVIEEDSHPELLILAGMALALWRPLLLIGPDAAVMEEDGRPDRILAGLPRVNARLSDHNALRFYVPAFLDAQRLGGVAALPRDVPGQPSDRRILSTAPPRSKLEEKIIDALSVSTEIQAVRSQPRLSGNAIFIPDFALWFRRQHGAFGNLVLLEAAAPQVGTSRREEQIDRLRAYASSSGVRTVFYVQDSSAQPLTLTRPGPWTFEVGVEPFLEEVRSGTLLQAMLRERNRLTHSAG